MSVRSASLYKLSDKIVICANARGQSGPPFDHEPFVQLSAPVPADALGRALKEAIGQFRIIEGEPQAETEFLSYFAQLSGFASYRQFMENAEYCAVEEADGTMVFHPMADDEVALATGSDDTALPIAFATTDEAIGHAAMAALAQAG